ncbi:MAG TPA: RagB/SusD family nutrient uptake outer membrane protein [Longimicrobiales bacterium]|nr:RagB/SusD family nutrient uptake outer membrane protein [Longimicrobiales bacterium]
MNANMTLRRVLAAAVIGLAVTGCSTDFLVPNYNNPARQDLTGTPTRATISAAVRGIVSTQRGLKAGMVTRLGVWGREGYDLRPEEPRTTTDALIDPIDPVNGGQYFGGQYTQIAQINTVLEALQNSPLSEQESRAVSGLVKTMKADAMWQAAIARALEVGLPLDPNPDPNGDLAPIVSKAEVWSYIDALYDEAQSDLSAGGSSFPMALPSGFDNFDTPQNFIKVNRALKARALKYQGDWAGTIAAVNASFADTGLDMDYGAYFDYSTISGDAANGFYSSPYHYAHPRIRDEAQLQADGSIDARVTRKLSPIGTFTLFDITVEDAMNVYQSLTDPMPWITNDELLLLRAEANFAQGNKGAAITDINAVRTKDGGLPALDPGYSGDVLKEILYNKLRSLLWEGGFQYYDYRQYNMLDELPRARPNHGVYPGFPYPLNECLARDIEGQVECTTYFAN